MQNISQFSRHVHKRRHVVIIEFKVGMLKEVFNVSQVTGNKVVHSDDMKPFLEKPVAKVRSQKASAAGNENSLIREGFSV